MQRVLDAIPRKRLRDRVLFGLIVATGLRAAEVRGVYVEDREGRRVAPHPPLAPRRPATDLSGPPCYGEVGTGASKVIRLTSAATGG